MEISQTYEKELNLKLDDIIASLQRGAHDRCIVLALNKNYPNAKSIRKITDRLFTYIEKCDQLVNVDVKVWYLVPEFDYNDYD